MSEVIILSAASAYLALGLDWLPLIGGGAQRAAYRAARRHKASHLVLDGEAAGAVGYGLLRLRRGQAVHSAAQNLARLFPSGAAAMLLKLDSGRYWLAAVHEGAVVARTDKLYDSPAEGRAVLDELLRAYPHMRILGQDGAAAPPSLSALAAAGDAQTLLRPVARLDCTRRALPLALLALGALALANAGLGRRPPAGEAAPMPDAAAVLHMWRQADAAAARAAVIHGVSATRALLLGLHALPARLAGWALQRAVCEPVQRNWRCSAQYQRRDAGADNADLLAAAPQDWRLGFPSIDSALAQWRPRAGALPPGFQALRSSAHNLRHLQSALQAMQPAFTRMRLGPARPLPIAPPHDAQGRTPSRPAELPRYARRSLRFDGPLRSAGMLAPHAHHMGWKKITLSLRDAVPPGLKASRLHISLEGDLYELLDPGTRPAEAGGPHD